MNRWWKGGMVVLTPFHARKANITSKLLQLLPEELVQDQQSEARLNVEAIRTHVQAAGEGAKPVLVGVDVFSTGVDLPGQALTKLTIAGLFPLREDWAYVAWRCRWFESVGGNGFEDYLLPERAITLEQQIGRVIRRESDNGVVCFFVENKDAKEGSQGQRIIAEALAKFEGIKELR
jgi:ATP-dependent DNA helicase DinG